MAVTKNTNFASTRTWVQISRAHIKSLAWMQVPVTEALGQTRKFQIPRAGWLASLVKVTSFCSGERPFLKDQGWAVIEEGIWHLPLASTSQCTGTSTCTFTSMNNTHVQTQLTYTQEKERRGKKEERLQRRNITMGRKHEVKELELF